MEKWQQVQLTNYVLETRHLATHDFRATVLAAEIGARGFVGYSAHQVCRQLGLPKKQVGKYLRSMAEAAERASSWIRLVKASKDT